MDKLKSSLGPVYKHAFWVTCGAIVVVSLGTWFVSTQLGLRSTTKANVEAIETAFSTANNVNSAGVDAAGQGNAATGVQFHPNETSAKGTERLNARLKTKVAEAWDLQYQQQRDLFVWPKQLSPAFKEAVRKKLEAPRWQFNIGDEQVIVDVLRERDAIDQIAREHGIDAAELKGKGKYVPYELPIEVVAPYPTPVNQEITDVFRRVYRDFVKSHVPTLAEKIGARWDPAIGMNPTSGSDMEGGYTPRTPSSRVSDPDASGIDVEDEIVTWNDQNKLHWSEKLTAFSDREAQDFVPTTLQMLYTQEDLWVLEAVLDIIKATNGDAKFKHEAAIKQLDYILTGKDAGEMPGTITPIGLDPTMTEEGYEEGYEEEGYMDEYSVEQFDEFGNPIVVVAVDPADDRYVNRDYEMISGAELREVFAQEPTIEQAYLRVAKRIPVRIGLKMDGRKLSQLLAACGNSPLVVEVRQIRINRHTPDGASGSSPYGDSEYGGEGSGGYGSGGYGSGDYGSTASDDSSTIKSLHDFPVEIYGVILIYNPVDAKTLEVKAAVGEEEPKTTGEPKPEVEPKPEQPKPEQPKPEQPKPEQPKPEQPKPEQPKPEQPKPVAEPMDGQPKTAGATPEAKAAAPPGSP